MTKSNKKLSIKCSLSSEIQCYHLFSCSTLRTCQNMNLISCSRYNVTGIPILKNEKADNSAIFWDIKLIPTCYRGSPWGCFGPTFCVFLIKIFWNIFKTFFPFVCHKFSFLKILKLRDSSFVSSSILRYLIPNNWS